MSDNLNLKSMKQSEILNKFNNEGQWPTDSELQFIANDRGGDNTMLSVELELLEIASSDVNHPYHHMTIPKPAPDWLNEWESANGIT